MMKKFLFFGVGVLFLLGMSQVVSAQSASMYTLDDIYYYLTEGEEATAGGHSLEPPVGAVPGDPLFKTLKQIYEGIQAEFDKCDATTADVLAGESFYSVQTGSWGVQTGQMQGTPPQIVIIGDMWVASSKDGLGCAEDGTMTWPVASSWANDLDWLAQTDWRLPGKAQGAEICGSKGELESIEDLDYHWTGEARVGVADHYWVWWGYDCGSGSNDKTRSRKVRAVRSCE